jgi:hypothetical protein
MDSPQHDLDTGLGKVILDFVPPEQRENKFLLF